MTIGLEFHEWLLLSQVTFTRLSSSSVHDCQWLTKTEPEDQQNPVEPQDEDGNWKSEAHPHCKVENIEEPRSWSQKTGWFWKRRWEREARHEHQRLQKKKKKITCICSGLQTRVGIIRDSNIRKQLDMISGAIYRRHSAIPDSHPCHILNAYRNVLSNFIQNFLNLEWDQNSLSAPDFTEAHATYL